MSRLDTKPSEIPGDLLTNEFNKTDVVNCSKMHNVLSRISYSSQGTLHARLNSTKKEKTVTHLCQVVCAKCISPHTDFSI